MTLKDWLLINRDTESLTLILRELDSQLKKIHYSGKCVMDFDISRITVATSNDENDVSVEYDKTSPVPKQFFQTYRDQNIRVLAMLGVSLYLGSKGKILDPSILKERFNDYIYLLPESEKDYYYDILVGEELDYQGDYHQKRAGGSNKGRAASMIKSNAYGKQLFDSESDPGFANVLIVPTFIILLLILILILYILFVRI